MYIVTNKSPTMFFISISIPGRSGVKTTLYNHDHIYDLTSFFKIRLLFEKITTDHTYLSEIDLKHVGFDYLTSLRDNDNDNNNK